MSYSIKTKQSSLIVILLIAFGSSLLATTTGKISGVVTDQSTGSALAGANVMVDGTSLGTSTSEDGSYFIINVPSGDHSVSASYIGYEKVTMTGLTVRIGKTTDADFALSSSAVEGASVTVVAEKPIVRKDLTASEQLVSSDEFEKGFARSIQEAMETKPGVFRGRFRGGAINGSVYMLDGASLNSGLLSENYQGINPTSVESITIQTGGYNAEYGSAMSAIVNVTTKRASEGIHGSFLTRMRPAGKYHHGDHIFSRDGWDWTNHDLAYWTTRTQTDGDTYYGQNPSELLTQWEDQLTPNAVLDDYDKRAQTEYEITLYGSPTEKINFLGSYRFLNGVNIFPQPQEYNPEYNFQGKLSYKVTDAITLGLNSIVGGYETAARGPQGSVDDAFYQAERGMEGTWFDSPFIRDPYDGSKFDKLGGWGAWPMVASFSTHTLNMTHVLNKNTFYEVSVSQLESDKDASDRDCLICTDSDGDGVPDKTHADNNVFGMLGYYQVEGYLQNSYVSNSKVSTIKADVTSQVNAHHGVKAGIVLKSYDFMYHHKLSADYSGSRWNLMNVFDGKPTEGAVYVQDKIEYEGLIMNVGVRMDWFNQNRDAPANMFDPTAFQETTPGNVTPNIPGNPETVATETQTAISPRLGFSHPISDNTVLHFNYGHFHQRPSWAKTHGFPYINYHNEAAGDVFDPYDQASISFSERYGGYVGNPYMTYEKMIQYEVGFDQNIRNSARLDITGYYKDGNRITTFSEGGMTEGGVGPGASWTYLNNTAGRGQGVMVSNKAFTDTRGFEVSVTSTLDGMINGSFSYDQSYSTGAAVGWNSLYENPESIDAPSSYQQYKKPWLSNVQMKGTININPISGLNINIYNEWFQGAEYTWHAADDPSTEPYNMRWLPHKRTNLKASYGMSLGGFRPELSIEVRNLFDDKDRIRPGGADMDAWQEDNDFVANHWRSGEENVWGAYNQFTNPMRQVYMQLKVDF